MKADEPLRPWISAGRRAFCFRPGSEKFGVRIEFLWRLLGQRLAKTSPCMADEFTKILAGAARGPYLFISGLRSLLVSVRDLASGRVPQFTLSTIESVLGLSFEKYDGSEDFMVSEGIQSETCPPCNPGSSRSTHKYRFVIRRHDLPTLERQLESALKVCLVIGQP